MLRYVERPAGCGNFPRPETMSEPLYRLLLRRGITSTEQAQAFLHPGEPQLNDPLRLNDMAVVVETLNDAISRGARICIYGDYDVDGVCACAILHSALSALGSEAEVYLPSRHDEGYGLNEAAVREIAARSDLLITVDCGIASCSLIALAQELGLTCIVTDHHRPNDTLPPCPVVNPLLNSYPDARICGAGVAFKLAQALLGHAAAMDFIDLAALATVADVVPLVGENRAIVALGLQAMNEKPRTGIAALMEAARVDAGALSAEGIAYRLAPRLNAGGRLGSARRSYELLVETDAFSAVAQADALEQENSRRQALERAMRTQAYAQLADVDLSRHRILLVRGTDWNSGVIGLVASHLRKETACPVIALSESEGMLTGSCRSIEGVDIFLALSSAADLMEKFGGHAQAAGLTVRSENFQALWDALDDYLQKNCDPNLWIPHAEYDMEIALNDLSEALVRELRALEPTGCENPAPVFRARAQLTEARPVGADKAHLRITAAQNGARVNGIFFGAGAMADRAGAMADLLFSPQLNTFGGRVSVEMSVCALRDDAPDERLCRTDASTAEKQRRFLTELFYNRGVYLQAQPRTVSVAEAQALMQTDFRGTLVLCANAQTAAALAANGAADICIGRLPNDARGFNAVCLYPETLDNLPAAYHRVLLADVPAWRDMDSEREFLTLQDAPAPLWQLLPDRDQLRETLRALVKLARANRRMRDTEALDMALCDLSGLETTTCHAALIALNDLKLILWQPQPFVLKMDQLPPTADPDNGEIFRAYAALKNRTEGGIPLDRN